VFADGQVDRACGPRRERDEGFLAALADDRQGAVAALDGQRFDVGADSFGDPQPVEGEQGDQGVFGGAAQPGGDQDRPDFVAVDAATYDQASAQLTDLVKKQPGWEPLRRRRPISCREQRSRRWCQSGPQRQCGGACIPATWLWPRSCSDSGRS
jgi:hypothetical protein